MLLVSLRRRVGFLPVEESASFEAMYFLARYALPPFLDSLEVDDSELDFLKKEDIFIYRRLSFLGGLSVLRLDGRDEGSGGGGKNCDNYLV